MKRYVICGRLLSGKVPKNRRLCGSYTVEAAMVMSIVLLVILQIIRGAFFLHDQVRGTMVLEEAIEQVRRGEWDETLTKAERQGNEKSSPMFHLSDYRINLKKSSAVYKGTAKSRQWEKEIVIRSFNPEEFLRLVRGVIF